MDEAMEDETIHHAVVLGEGAEATRPYEFVLRVSGSEMRAGIGVRKTRPRLI